MEKDKIIRVLCNSQGEDYLKNEMSVMNFLRDKGKNVPRVYQYLKVDGRPSVIMDRINGITMLDKMKKEPYKLLDYAEKFALIHLDVMDSAKGIELVSINARVTQLIHQSDTLCSELRQFVVEVLEELPKGNEICHGDFHPGNIMISDGDCFVIDWYGVTRGERLSDIAHTYLLYRSGNKNIGKTRISCPTKSFASNTISKKYLSVYVSLQLFDMSNFSKWMVVRAAERLTTGLPSEKKALIKFITRCREDYLLEIKASNWWKNI